MRAASAALRLLRRSAAGAGVIAAAVVVACSTGADGDYFGSTDRKGKDPRTAYINNMTEPEYLDPGKAGDTASSLLVMQLFEGLTAYDPKDLHPVQAVATRWEQSSDNRIFRFHLREEARWSDGVPVTAHDFEYAWKRVLSPATASVSSGQLYPIRNAELFNTGKLLRLRAEAPLRAEPRADAPVIGSLPKGSAVVVLARAPVVVSTAIAPLKRPPGGVRRVAYDPASDALTFPDGRDPIRASSSRGWKGSTAKVNLRGAGVECNGASDFFYEVGRGDDKGFLPGCAVGAVMAQVAPHATLPTYAARTAADATPAAPPKPAGYVDERLLEEDASVVGVRATDDHTLEVELEQPTPYFTDLTSIATYAPVREDVIEKFERLGTPELWFRPENMVSNGPFVLDAWRFRDSITMKKSETYWDRARMKLDRVVWLEVDDSNTTMNLYKSAEIDSLGDNSALPVEYLDVLKSKKDFLRFPFLSTYWYEFNTEKPPVNDARVRRALNLAIDKRELVEKITRGGQIPATHYVPDFTGLGYSDQVAADRAAGTDPFSTPETVFNPERARELLKEAGYEVVRDGDGYRATNFPSLEILYNTLEAHKQIAVAIQDMWRRHLGVSATMRNEEWKVMLKNVRDGNFQVVRFGWVGDYNHPHTFLDTFLSYNPNNRTHWGDKKFDDLLKKASATADPKESIALYRQAEKLVVDAMPKLPLYFYTRSTVTKPWLKGFTGNARNVHLVKWLWIDPNWRTNPSNEPAFPSLEFPPPGPIDPLAPGAGADPQRAP